MSTPATLSRIAHPAHCVCVVRAFALCHSHGVVCAVSLIRRRLRCVTHTASFALCHSHGVVCAVSLIRRRLCSVKKLVASLSAPDAALLERCYNVLHAKLYGPTAGRACLRARLRDAAAVDLWRARVRVKLTAVTCVMRHLSLASAPRVCENTLLFSPSVTLSSLMYDVPLQLQ